MSKVRARARVRLTVEVLLPSMWGPDCTTEQIMKQAKEDAIGIVRQGIVIDGLRNHNHATTHGTVVGEPIVTTILAEDEYNHV